VVLNSSLATDYALAWQSNLVAVGDGNGDGKVDGLDYILWADHFGQSGRHYWEGDYDQNGVVNGLDYILWADSFGPGAAAFPNLVQGSDGGSGSGLDTGGVSVVPEPASLVLAAGGLAIVLATALRRRRTARV
jgi:hypothetical protein